MHILIFDTETTSLTKPFAYNIGYVIADTETEQVAVRRDFVVEQVWHNLELFSSAYYAEKRPLYVERMRAKKAIMDKFGYVCGQIIRDIKAYEIAHAYAFNSPFDDSVFAFCCDWFKCKNPFDNIAIHDIRAYAINYLVDGKYKEFCEMNEFFTDNGNYSTTAETFTRYLSGAVDFVEEHTALADSEIETEILFECIKRGADITVDMVAPKMVEREIERALTVEHNGEKHIFTYHKRINRESGNRIILK